ncbi:putative disease resistance protein RGA3 isoform X1 [Vitis riparia]|uniref:putative disease resistance protein RGA3 isoform X1 n=1 Tax=Vitis riparia TaxID=96939 RepID=UPI00155AD9CE|nr:putative disease resistance protein RGA3 isoform X1 [Vitis riparia]
MAEQIPFNIIADVLTKLGSLAFRQIGSAFGVAKELTKLTEKLDAIRGVLVDAEKRQEESDGVKAWVRRLKDVVYDADDLLDDFETLQLQRGGVARQVSDFFSSSNQLVFRCKMSHRLKDIKERIDEIVEQMNLLNLVQGNIVQREVESSWRETHSFVLTSEIVGREETKEEIIKSLVSSDNQEILSMVAIVGIGGLGKTTLAQLVYNAETVVQYFEPRIWVCVSDNFDVKSLVKKILKEVCEQDVERLELNGLKNLLHEKISEKRCLLVLDDVWNENSEEWDRLKSLLMVVGRGSKILVTTRHSKVASIMGINSPFLLQGLKDTLAWDLFSKIAFTEEPKKVHPKFVEMGKEIVNMCKGVPLVIKTLGTILRLKPEESHWLSIKNNGNLLSLGAENDNVLSVLRLSYNDLPIYLKPCFTYCALFPKDYEIEKNMLVQLWMAQGYIQTSDVGNQYFKELLSRSLLEVAKKDVDDNISSCKMHDLIHDLAQSIVGSEVLFLKENVEKEKISERVYHVSFFKMSNIHWKDLKHTRTIFILKFDKWTGIDNSICSTTLIPNFKCSRVLSLNQTVAKKIPKSIGKLSHLRYLNLSWCDFKVLPNAITRLYNLQTLKLTGCRKLKEFPKDTRELINLRHLENDWCRSLSYMPCGIGRLTLLESLPLFVIGTGSKVGRLSELKRLNNLRGKLRIEKLGNVRDANVESEEANLGEKQYIESLRLEWSYGEEAQSGEDAESVMVGLRPHRNLKELFITGYEGRVFPSWMMNGGLSCILPNLIKINLESCSGCQILPSFVELPHLKSLNLWLLEKVEYMEYCSSGGPFFPSLEYLRLNCMPKLKELWRRDLSPTHPPSFPRLLELTLRNCDELASLELHSSPLLSKLEITECHKLEYMDYCSSGGPFFPSLEYLRLERMPKLKELWRRDLSPTHPPSFPRLLELTLRNCDELASLELHSSPLLSKLNITQCPKLTSLRLPPSPLLSQLYIWYCGDLASLELHSSPLLSKLEIEECHKLTSVLLPHSPLLSSLDIRNCPQLTSLLFSPSPCLEKLYLCKVKEVVLRELMLATASLESVSVESIDDLRSLPDELRQHVSTLQTLKIWDCSRLATIPHWIGNLTSLTELGIRYCPELTSLPQEMRSLTNLHSLSIDYSCGLASLPNWIGSLTSLTDLEIGSCSQFTSLPEELRSLGILKSLTLRDWSGLTMSDWIGSLTSLTDLEIGPCPELTSLPEELRSLRILKSLTIHDWSGLTTLPNWIGNLSSLEKLRISECPKLTSLPEEMRSLTNLHVVEFIHCPYLFERRDQEQPKIAHASSRTFSS